MNRAKVVFQKFYESLKQVAKTCILQLKSTFANPILLFMLFVFPTVLLFGVGALIRETSIFVSAFGLVQILLIGILFGNYKYSFEKSTLGDNLKLTHSKGSYTTIAMIIIIFVLSLGVFVIQLCVMQLCESVDFIFMDGFIFQDDNSLSRIDINWAKLNYTPIFMFYFETYLLSMSIYYFTSNFFASNRTFSIFVLCYMIINLTLGGVVSEYWLVFNPLTDEFVTNSNVTQSISEGAKGWDDFKYYENSFTPTNWTEYVPFFFPQWFSNKHYFSVFTVGGVQSAPDLAWNQIRALPEGTSFNYWSKYDQFWNFAALAPYLYSISFISLAWVVNKKPL